ncbi:putative ribonuclease H-like domain-containing protein [Tanacetum coccineum]
MLSDSLLPIPFWAEAVNTACYVLNRVLVTKPQNKTPYELLIGYLLGYSTFSKAFRVYNKRNKRVEENLHINFLEDQSNVTGISPNWMFDLDFLTNSMNYIPVSVENPVNVDAITQYSYVTGSSGKEKGPTQEYILLPLQPHRTRIPIEDVPPAAHEKPFKSSPKENDVQDSEDAANKESKQDLQDELEKMVTQELVAKVMDDVSRQALEKEKRRIASQKKEAQATSTNKLSTDRQYVSTDRPFVSTDRLFWLISITWITPSVSTTNIPYVSATRTSTGVQMLVNHHLFILEEKYLLMHLLFLMLDFPIVQNMPDLEDASVYSSPNVERFNGGLCDENFKQEGRFKMDVKGAFLYGTIEEEVYVHQPLGFVDPAHPNKVYKVIKDIFRSTSSPRAWIVIMIEEKILYLGNQLIHIEADNYCVEISTTLARFETEYVFVAANWSQVETRGFKGRKVTPLFDSMLVQQTEDEGDASERPSDSPPIPSPSFTRSEGQPQRYKPNPSPKPSPTTHIPDSIPEGSGGNHGGQSSNDASLSGNEDGQEAKERSQTTYHTSQSWLKDKIGMDLLLDYMEIKDDQNEWRTSSMVLEDKESANKEVSTEGPISTDKKNEGTDKKNDGTGKQDGWYDRINKSFFGDDETIAQVLIIMSQNKEKLKEKEKGVELRNLANDEEVARKKGSRGWELKREKKRLAGGRVAITGCTLY